jgi:hypothetical protein
VLIGGIWDAESLIRAPRHHPRRLSRNHNWLGTLAISMRSCFPFSAFSGSRTSWNLYALRTPRVTHLFCKPFNCHQVHFWYSLLWDSDPFPRPRIQSRSQSPLMQRALEQQWQASGVTSQQGDRRGKHHDTAPLTQRSAALDIKLTMAHSQIGIHNSSCTYPNLWRRRRATAFRNEQYQRLKYFLSHRLLDKAVGIGIAIYVSYCVYDSYEHAKRELADFYSLFDRWFRYLRRLYQYNMSLGINIFQTQLALRDARACDVISKITALAQLQRTAYLTPGIRKTHCILVLSNTKSQPRRRKFNQIQFSECFLKLQLRKLHISATLIVSTHLPNCNFSISTTRKVRSRCH